MNPAAPFGIAVAASMLDATTALLGSIGYLPSVPAVAAGSSAASPGDTESLTFIGDAAEVGVLEITVTTPTSTMTSPTTSTASATSATSASVTSRKRIVRLAVVDPLGVWCRWHLDGVATSESDIDQFLHDPAAGLIVRCNDGNHYELMPIAGDALHNRALFVETDPTMLTDTVTSFCEEFGFRPISAEPFHHHHQMTLLQRGGRYRMMLGLLTPNATVGAQRR